MTEDLSLADFRMLKGYFSATLAERGPRTTFEWIIQTLATQPANLRSTNCVFVAFTGRVEGIDWLEEHIQTPVIESWGRAAALLGVAWPRIERWLAGSRDHVLMALDALAHYREPTPNMAPIDQIVAPILPEPPTESVFDGALDNVLLAHGTPRVRSTVKYVRALSPEILGRTDRRVPVEELPRAYLRPELYQHAGTIIRKHDEVTSAVRQSMQDMIDRSAKD